MADTLQPCVPAAAKAVRGVAEQDTLTVPQAEAARLTGLSAKTLDRLARRGEPVGQVKVGRRVLYHRATLARWLETRAAGARAG